MPGLDRCTTLEESQITLFYCFFTGRNRIFKDTQLLQTNFVIGIGKNEKF